MLHGKGVPSACSVLLCAALLAACSSPEAQSAVDAGLPTVVEGTCERAADDAGAATEYLRRIGCTADFLALASEPLDATLSGARSAKVVLDTADDGALYYQNSVLYPVHYEFVSTHLSGNGLPVVPALSDFNTTEYYSPERRFILGAVTWYDGPKAWVLELAPYDTAPAAMITVLFEAVKSAGFFGPGLAFHPTSEATLAESKGLSSAVPVTTTEQLWAGTDYQPLTLGRAIGRLRFTTAAALEEQYLSYEEIVVLDQAPNDLSVVQGLVTEEFQTPLSHVNVLSQNRGTPNMGLRGAMQSAELRALKNKLVELTVGSLEWSVREASEAEATAFWAAHRPAPIALPALDLSVTGLVDAEAVTAEPAGGETLREKIKAAVDAFGGKAAQYSILARTPQVPTLKAFAIPVFYYEQFMRQNGFWDRLDALLADPEFVSDSQVRDAALQRLRSDMQAAPLDAGLQALLEAKIAADYPGLKLRFRTSTNAEDLEGFPCAGCYESHTGDPADWPDLLDAVRETYASAWLFRTFEERSYYGVDHKAVGMALLVHRNFPDEEANGVAVTANPFDASGLDPAFYVNVQHGGSAEVVHPPTGITSDQFLYFFDSPNQPVSYLAHSNLVPQGSSVLSAAQIHQLGVALAAIRARFSHAYGPAAGIDAWYAMDVEFKFDDQDAPGEPPALYVKQARPYPGRSAQ